MGYYINPTFAPKGKAQDLVVMHNAEIISQPKSFDEVPVDKALICVVDNGPFEAAALCFSEQEFVKFSEPDLRPKTWLIMEKLLAHDMAGFTG